jgi:phytoene dehydrogenase-like protein
MSHIFIQGNPLLLHDELGPQAQVRPPVPVPRSADDERVGGRLDAAAQPRPATSRPRRSASSPAKDAETFLELSRQAAEWLPMIQAGLYSPPMPVGAQTAMMDQSAEGREIMRTIGMSTFDLMEELFEHDKVKATSAASPARTWSAPTRRRPGSALRVPRILEKFGFGVPVGGSGKLTDALIACIEDHGGAVRRNAQVREVETDGSPRDRRGARQRRAAVVRRRA